MPPEDDDYAFWCETHPCSTCDGTGEVMGDQWDHTCGTCDGSGIDPAAEALEGD